MLLFDGEDDDAVAAARERWGRSQGAGVRGDLLAARRAGPLGQEGLTGEGALMVAAANMVTQSWVWVRRGREDLGSGRAVFRNDFNAFRRCWRLAPAPCRTRIRSARPTAASFVPADVGDELPGQGAAAGGARRSGRRQRQLRRRLAPRCQRRSAASQCRSGGGIPGPAAIALEMTECDVVKRAGVAERVEIGTNDRRERTATLTYISGRAARHL